jgi:hypothetical protein
MPLDWQRARDRDAVGRAERVAMVDRGRGVSLPPTPRQMEYLGQLLDRAGLPREQPANLAAASDRISQLRLLTSRADRAVTRSALKLSNPRPGLIEHGPG